MENNLLYVFFVNIIYYYIIVNIVCVTTIMIMIIIVVFVIINYYYSKFRLINLLFEFLLILLWLRLQVLGSKTLGTNVLELQFVLC